jgi:hypothetical protein
MLADGLVRGGRAEAQTRLADFWRAASSNGNLPKLQRAVMERLLSFTPTRCRANFPHMTSTRSTSIRSRI